MVLNSPPPRFSHLLGSVSRFLGYGDYRLRQIYRRAASLRLPFTEPPKIAPNIWWSSAGLASLANLPRSALSGPVQEDKALAYQALRSLVSERQETCEQLELRQIDGLAGTPGEPFNRLEDLVLGHPCRRFRIISYQDFERVIRLALPRFPQEPIYLLSTDWIERLFWAGTREREAFACAVVYARVRGLNVSLPAQVTRYQLDKSGFNHLRGQYHALFMPNEAWTTPGLMHLLLETEMPYARLAKVHPNYQEVLLLPRNRQRSNALGLGLRKAGAFDAAQWLASAHTAV